MRVVFVRQFVHLATHFISATGVKHVLAELVVSYEPVVDAQEELLAFLLERIRDVVLAVPWLLPVMVPVGSPSLGSDSVVGLIEEHVELGSSRFSESILDRCASQ